MINSVCRQDEGGWRLQCTVSWFLCVWVCVFFTHVVGQGCVVTLPASQRLRRLLQNLVVLLGKQSKQAEREKVRQREREERKTEREGEKEEPELDK